MPTLREVITKITTEDGLRNWLLIGHDEDGNNLNGGSGSETVDTIAASGTAQTLNVANGTVFDVTLTGNCTFTLTAAATTGTAQSITVILRQDSTGSRTVTWPGSVSWLGTAPTLQTAAGAVDVVSMFTVNNGTTWYAYADTSPPSSFHGCKVYNSTVQSLATGGTGAAITFDSEDWDSDGFHDTVTNNSRITCPSGLDGKYRFTFTTFCAAAMSGGHIFFKKNGTTLRGGTSRSLSDSGGAYTGPAVAEIDMVATDYVEVWINQTSGVSVNIGNASVEDARSVLCVEKL